MRTFIRTAVVAALLAASIAAPNAAAAAEGRSPIGFKMFCIKNPAQCQPGGSSSLHLTDDVMGKLKSVNASVNRAIRPRHDARGKDVWTLNAKTGDCEDYVITKRSRLIQMGLPASALRIAYAKTSSGEGHAVLVVKTNKGDYVLDNRTSSIRPKSQSGLRFISISTANPKKWVSA